MRVRAAARCALADKARGAIQPRPMCCAMYWPCARYMLPDDCPDAGVRLMDAQRYYLRLPIGMPLPEWAGAGCDTGEYRVAATGPVPPQAVYALASENKNVFFARLQKE